MSSETRDLDFWCSLIVGCLLGLYVLICTCMSYSYHWSVSRKYLTCKSNKWKCELLHHVQLFVTPWTVPPRLLCPWDSSGKNTGKYSHSLLQQIFPTQGSNPGLLHYRQIIYCQSHQGRPCPIKQRLKLERNLWEACSSPSLGRNHEKQTRMFFESTGQNIQWMPNVKNILPLP